ncbi:hypothetical protein GBA52_016129 [Prunus armeniaca]|nr:hypothetical protein GBA52_016129 [Prunus armeniaca]
MAVQVSRRAAGGSNTNAAGLAQNGVVLLTTHVQEAKLDVSKAAKRPRRREARVLLTMAC